MRFLKILFITLITLFISVHWGSGFLLSFEGFRNLVEYVSDMVPHSFFIAALFYGLWLIFRSIKIKTPKVQYKFQSTVEDVPPEWIHVIDIE